MLVFRGPLSAVTIYALPSRLASSDSSLDGQWNFQFNSASASFSSEKNKQNTEKSHHVTLKSPWKCHPRSPILETPRLLKPPWPWPDFYPQMLGWSPFTSCPKKGSRFHSTHPPKKVTNSQNCQVVLFVFKKKSGWKSPFPSIHPLKKMVLTRVPEISLSLSLSQKETGLFLITLSVEILGSRSQRKNPKGCQGTLLAILGSLPSSLQTKSRAKCDFYRWLFVGPKNGCRFFQRANSKMFQFHTSFTWGGLLPGQVVFQWISRRSFACRKFLE